MSQISIQKQTIQTRRGDLAAAERKLAAAKAAAATAREAANEAATRYDWSLNARQPAARVDKLKTARAEARAAGKAADAAVATAKAAVDARATALRAAEVYLCRLQQAEQEEACERFLLEAGVSPASANKAARGTPRRPEPVVAPQRAAPTPTPAPKRRGPDLSRLTAAWGCAAK